VADRVVLHIGTMKSGTTYLQDVLSSGVLESAGGWYVGGTFGAQTSAVRRLLRPPAERRPEEWEALAREARERDGVAVFSQEFLSFARPPRAQQIVSSFGGAPVELVLAVRDQHSAMPAQWQSFTRNRGLDDWATYQGRLEQMAGAGRKGRRSKAVKSFRRAQDVPGILRRWGSAEGLAGISVVVVPPSGSEPTALWRRFCEAATLDAGDPEAAGRRSNESLGYASCDALVRVNRGLEPLDKRQYTRARKRLLEALLPLRPDEGRPVLSAAGAEVARELNAGILEAIDHHGVRLVGERSELPVDDPGTAPAEVPPPDPAQVQRALVAAWEGCVSGAEVPDVGPDQLAARLGRRLVKRAGR
jgi:hypothetical protein